MNYGVNHWRENARVLVYDLGGGTFDVTLVQMRKGNYMESLQTTGDHMLGGKDWDSRISMLVEEKIEGETGLSATEYPEIHQIVGQNAENIKKQLTTRNAANVRVKLPDYGWYSTTVSLEEFEQSTNDLIERTGTLCESLLRGLNMSWRDVTDILLVGGSTRMRQVTTFLKRSADIHRFLRSTLMRLWRWVRRFRFICHFRNTVSSRWLPLQSRHKKKMQVPSNSSGIHNKKHRAIPCRVLSAKKQL